MTRSDRLNVAVSLVLFSCLLPQLADTFNPGRAVYPTLENEDRDFWMEVGANELSAAKDRAKSFGLSEDDLRRQGPKNVILFVGDGMGPTTQLAARIRKGQMANQSGEEARLAWEQFPSMGMLKTYSVNKQVPDSASTATSLFTGVKTNYEMVGFDSSATLGSVESQMKATKVSSVLKWAQDKGMRTGLVTNTRLTHATPSAAYAHSADRRWECDAKLPKSDAERYAEEEDLRLKDIARQLIEDEPGRNLNVALGGGRASFQTDLGGAEVDSWACQRKDGRDLVEAWLKRGRGRDEGGRYRFVDNARDLEALEDEEHVLGLFSTSHMSYEDERPADQPSVKQMVLKAIQLLSKPDSSSFSSGYLLLVEGGLIDMAHHRGWANRAISETLALDEAVEAAVEAVHVGADADADTLVIATSDHAHTLRLAGYPVRGNEIRGLIGEDDLNGHPMVSLTYANGEGFNNSRVDLGQVDTTQIEFQQPAAYDRIEETHGAGDVPVWAKGPLHFLFHTSHEQNYIAHMIAFSLCMGPYKDGVGCAGNQEPSRAADGNVASAASLVVLLCFSYFSRWLLRT